MDDNRGFVAAMVGDGRPPLAAVGLGLFLAGLFGLFLAITGEFLPHDERYLGMTAADLCALHGCRVVHFMAHDRASFGGALVGLGLMYLWLTAFPLRQGEAWAWWVFLLTGLLGFGSFFAYLGYGYLDWWHATATVGLLLVYGAGMGRAWATLPRPAGWACLLRPGAAPAWRSAAGIGRACLLASSAGLIAGGLVILGVGTTCVFVPEDLAYMGVEVAELHALNPRLVPLIAHDRAGFGGAVACCGIALFFSVWCGRPSRSRWQVLALTGAVGFGVAIGVHPAVGYLEWTHLAPAIGGAVLFLTGLVLTARA